MSIRITVEIARPDWRPMRVRDLWRAWRLWRDRARQERHLSRITLDPHIARDLGLPVRKRPTLRPEFW